MEEAIFVSQTNYFESTEKEMISILRLTLMKFLMSNIQMLSIVKPDKNLKSLEKKIASLNNT